MRVFAATLLWCGIVGITGCGGKTTTPGDTADGKPTDIELADDSETEDVEVTITETEDSTPTAVDSDAGQDAGADTAPPPPEPSPLEACQDALVPAPTWDDSDSKGDLELSLEFGQTHIVKTDDARLAPRVNAERETLVLITPSDVSQPLTDMRIGAFGDRGLMGVLRVSPPGQLPEALEQAVTTVELEPYSADAWSVILPWNWMKPEVTLRISARMNGELWVHDHALTSLGAPHHFTLTRTHMVLFGDPLFDIVAPQTSSKVARDMAPWVPGAELRFVDTSPWRLDRIVVNTETGPQWANSEGERLNITNDANRWNIIKHQGALRLSLANTGRGLRLTGSPEGDSSPYSYGTSMTQGWVRTDDGTYRDINNAGLAAGWTGWSGMWLDECGNGFIHEVGHTFTLEHFTEGTATGWGIADEYPLDGVHLPTHPWGYDSVRRRLRTWYRVERDGPVLREGQLVGKNDPMNGGEAASTASCFPQYTPYQMMRSQNWLEGTPTIMTIEGQPGIYRWNVDQGRYLEQAPALGNQAPVATDVEVLTLIGTLGNSLEVCQTYPPIAIPEGNAFTLPDPESPEHSPIFDGAHWFVEVRYGDGSLERGLINRGEIATTDVGLYLYSLNVIKERSPESVALYFSPTPYPNMDLEAAQLVHTRAIPSTYPAEPVLRIGRGQDANDELRLGLRCEPNVNCETRTARADFRVSDAPISFALSEQSEQTEFSVCNAPGGVSQWTVGVKNELGEQVSLTVNAQRLVESGEHAVRVSAIDRTPWIGAANLRQSLLVWLPYADNSALAPGRYQTDGTVSVDVYEGEVLRETLALRLDVTVRASEKVVLSPGYVSEGVSIDAEAPESSVYFLFEDPSLGPSAPLWWGDATGDIIGLPVRAESDGSDTTLSLRVHKEACGSLWNINSGQAAEWGCSHAIRLEVEPGMQSSLTSGETYRTPPSSPVVITAHRWHEPEAGKLLRTFAFELSYTAP